MELPFALSYKLFIKLLKNTVLLLKRKLLTKVYNLYIFKKSCIISYYDGCTDSMYRLYKFLLN